MDELPLELLERILRYLTDAELENFALVSKGLRQKLFRCRLFYTAKVEWLTAANRPFMLITKRNLLDRTFANLKTRFHFEAGDFQKHTCLTPATLHPDLVTLTDPLDLDQEPIELDCSPQKLVVKRTNDFYSSSPRHFVATFYGNDGPKEVFVEAGAPFRLDAGLHCIEKAELTLENLFRFTSSVDAAEYRCLKALTLHSDHWLCPPQLWELCPHITFPVLKHLRLVVDAPMEQGQILLLRTILWRQTSLEELTINLNFHKPNFISNLKPFLKTLVKLNLVNMAYCNWQAEHLSEFSELKVCFQE